MNWSLSKQKWRIILNSQGVYVTRGPTYYTPQEFSNELQSYFPHKVRKIRESITNSPDRPPYTFTSSAKPATCSIHFKKVTTQEVIKTAWANKASATPAEHCPEKYTQKWINALAPLTTTIINRSLEKRVYTWLLETGNHYCPPQKNRFRPSRPCKLQTHIESHLS